MAKNSLRELLTSWRVLMRSVPLLWRAAPAPASTLLVLLVIQGTVPALAVYLTKLTVDGISEVIQGGQASLVSLALLWGNAGRVRRVVADAGAAI